MNIAFSSPVRSVRLSRTASAFLKYSPNEPKRTRGNTGHSCISIMRSTSRRVAPPPWLPTPYTMSPVFSPPEQRAISITPVPTSGVMPLLYQYGSRYTSTSAPDGACQRYITSLVVSPRQWYMYLTAPNASISGTNALWPNVSGEKSMFSDSPGTPHTSCRYLRVCAMWRISDSVSGMFLSVSTHALAVTSQRPSCMRC